MNGPDHFREGERELQAAYGEAESQTQFFHLAASQAHFLAALVALQASAKAPGSVSWQEAIGA